MDQKCNNSSGDLNITLLDAPLYSLTLQNQSLPQNVAGNVSLGEEVALKLTVDFPSLTEDTFAMFDLTDDDNNMRIRPIEVSTLARGVNLIVDVPVLWKVIQSRFHNFSEILIVFLYKG